MSDELQRFLGDLITLLREKHDQSLGDYQNAASEGDEAFWKGANFAYYDTLDLIRSQILSFGFETDKLGPIVPEFGKRSG